MTCRAEPIAVPAAVIRQTQRHLRAQGVDSAEGVVLWQGTLAPPRVTAAIIPAQVVSSGRFEVPLAERQRIARELAGTGAHIVAQVHSHPGAAFHSAVDDAEAIPRRVGAFSLVVPDFGAREDLFDGAALFQLERDGAWRPAPLAAFLPQPQRSVARWLIDTLKSFGRSHT